MERVGFVISDSNTQKFNFLIQEEVKNNDFVIVNNGIFGRVVNIHNINTILRNEDMLRFHDQIKKFIAERRDSFNIAEVKILGIYKNETVERAYISPVAKQEVYRLDWDSIIKIFGIEKSDKNIQLGKFLPYNKPLPINPYQLIEKHFGVLAMSGAGKSNFIALLLKEFVEKDVGMPIVVFDMHNEYSAFTLKYNNYFGFESNKIHLNNEDINIDILKSLVDLSEIQEYILADAIDKMENKSIDNLIDYFNKKLEKELKENTSKTYRAIIRKLNYIKSLDLFNEIGEINNKIELLKEGKSIILDFSDNSNNAILSTKAYVFLKKIFEKRKKRELPPVLIIIEEAHLLASNESNNESYLSQQILTRIAREGRKFGVCLGIISQRPHYLNQTIMAQLNVQIFLRIVNPNDLDYVKSVSEQLTDEEISSIPTLLPGEAIISGLYRYPVFMKFDLIEKELKSQDSRLEEKVKEWRRNSYEKYQNIDI